MITDFWAVEDGKLVLYKRSGECNKCGACCDKAGISFQMSVKFKDAKEYEEEAENTKTVKWADHEGWSMFVAQGIWWYFQVNYAPDDEKPCHACGEYVDGLCASWDGEQWRPICRYWPFHPRDLERFPTCSFKFELVVQEGE